jgi:hypothetical protein
MANPSHAGHLPCHHAPPLSLFPSLGHRAKWHHLTLLHLPALALVEEIPHRRQTRTRPRRPAHAEDGVDVPTGTRSTRVVSPPRATPGPPLCTSSIVVPPRTRQTRAQHRPAPAIAGEDDRILPLPRSTPRPPDRVRHRLA